MKWLNLLFLLCIYNIGLSQEVSFHLQFNLDSLNFDSGLQILEISDGYIIMGQSVCDENIYQCLGLLRTDEEGNTIWRKNYGGIGDTLLHGNRKTMLILQDTIYIATFVQKSGHRELHMLSFDMSGNMLNSKDLLIPNNNLYLEGMIESNNKLIVFGELVLDGRSVFIRQFDLDFNVLVESEVGNSNFYKRGIDIKKSMLGGYILAYGEQILGSQVKMVLNKLDEQFNVLFSNEIPQSEDGEPFLDVNIIETEEDDYMLAWNKDLSHALYDTFPYPATIYKLDSLFNVEWEYIFVHKAYKEFLSFSRTSNGNFFGVGATDYFEIHNIYPNRVLDGWCFLIATDGTLLWERTIADNTKEPSGGVFRDGVETENGFTLIGDIGINYMNQLQDIWLLSLDENGCWNGNCNQYIIITGDTTSITTGTTGATLSKKSIKAYPNPTAGTLTIETGNLENTNTRIIQILHANGMPVINIQLKAPRSTINLSHLPDGVYYIRYLDNGKQTNIQKIIVQH